MTDRELLEQVNSKLDALAPRVEALEASASGAVSHDEVQSVVDKESDLETRVGALESVFGDGTSGLTSTTDSFPGLFLAPDETPVKNDVPEVPANHEIS